MKNASGGGAAKYAAAVATVLAAIIAAIAAFHQKPSPTAHAIYQQGSSNTLKNQSENKGVIKDQSENKGVIFGDNNQGTQIQNSKDIVINQGRVSAHPVTSDMNLKWNMDDFAESVRNGNLPAIKEYLNPKDGFDPNALWNGTAFVLELPLAQGTHNFPEILELFKETGKLDWNAVNERSSWGVSSLQWTLLYDAAYHNNLRDLKALLDAGADPEKLIADEVKAFNTPSDPDALYSGILTGRPRDRQGYAAERVLATFKTVGYPLPDLTQAIVKASITGKPCMQEIKAHHSLQEAMALASKPQEPSTAETPDWPAFQIAVARLRDRLRSGPPGAGRTYQEEYDLAIWESCGGE